MEELRESSSRADEPRPSLGRRTETAEEAVSGVAGLLHDLLALAAGMVEFGMAQVGRGRVGEPFLSPFAALLGASAPMGDIAEAERSAAAAGKAGPSDRRKPDDMGAFLTQACLVMATGGVRYWWRMAQTHAAHQSGILRSFVARAGDLNMSEQERRLLVDEIRAYLREIGDVSVREARVVQTQLDGLADGLAESTLGPEQPMKHWRRWKAIP